MVSIVELKDVTKRYTDILAVDGLNLTVNPGEILGIIGHNGAGKSTTLKMILGLIAPTAGHVQVMGHDMVHDSARVKQFIGYLPEESPLYDTMKVNEYLLFFSRLYGLPKAAATTRIGELLDSLNLEARDRLTGELSKGMRRKVTIARALLHDPQLLVLDEPNSGLDPLTSFFIINYLKRLRDQGKTILVSAHNLFHIEYICDRVAILKSGRLVVCDSMEAIRNSLGSREYEVVFRTEQKLDYPQVDGNYVLKTAEIAGIAAALEDIAAHNWALVNLTVHQSALEDIYVKLMTT